MNRGVELIDILERNDVVNTTRGFELTEAFDITVARYRDALTASGSIDDLLAEIDDGDEFALSQIERLPHEAVPTYLAVLDWTSVKGQDALRAVATIEHLSADTGPDEGAPEAFVPVRASSLPTIVTVYDPCVVYVWRRECRPCDLMRSTFDELFAEPPDEPLLIAVFGPDDPGLLQERYDVYGGPTTLFVRNGRVDSRLLGAHHRETLERELALLQSDREPNEVTEP